jgi:hypothetical protein
MKINVWLFGAIVLLAIMVGVIAGISIGTYAVIDHVAYGLAGSTFVVNFNETRLVNQMADKFIPIFNQSMQKPIPCNETIMGNGTNCVFVKDGLTAQEKRT